LTLPQPLGSQPSRLVAKEHELHGEDSRETFLGKSIAPRLMFADTFPFTAPK